MCQHNPLWQWPEKLRRSFYRKAVRSLLALDYNAEDVLKNQRSQFLALCWSRVPPGPLENTRCYGTATLHLPLGRWPKIGTEQTRMGRNFCSWRQKYLGNRQMKYLIWPHARMKKIIRCGLFPRGSLHSDISITKSTFRATLLRSRKGLVNRTKAVYSSRKESSYRHQHILVVRKLLGLERHVTMLWMKATCALWKGLGP